MRPRLLDLFCKAGGAAKGYHDAGFEVIGVDIEPQPRYPYEFRQADAMKVLETGWINDALPIAGFFDAIHASPPCQDHSTTKDFGGDHGTGWMLAATLDLLPGFSLPWVVENVKTAPLARQDDLFGATGLELCGCMFPDLRGLLYEARLFQTSFAVRQPSHVLHRWAADQDGAATQAGRVHATDGALQRRAGGAQADAPALDDAGRARAGHPSRVHGTDRPRPARAPGSEGGRRVKLCLCSHTDRDHPGGECIHRACGCTTWRLDYRSPVRDDPETAATGDAA